MKKLSGVSSDATRQPTVHNAPRHAHAPGRARVTRTLLALVLAMGMLTSVLVDGTVLGGPAVLDVSAAACDPRPPIRVSVTAHDSDRLRVTLTAEVSSAAPANRLREIRFSPLSASLFDFGTMPWPVANGVARLTNGPAVATFLVRRPAGASALTIPLTVVDDCGSWPTFVGGGPAAFPSPPSAGTATAIPTPPSTPTPTPTLVPTTPTTPTATPTPGPAVTWLPTALALSDPELVSPRRGAYRWYGEAPEPSGWPALDSYRRYYWREIEPTEGAYTWTSIDAELAQAASRGGRFGLRVMPAVSSDGGSAIPDYLMLRLENGFSFTYPGTATQVYAPDWNDPDYLNRAEALIRALAQQYANDDRLGWIEIGPYGDFGEWHVYQWPYPALGGAQDMTLANRRRLIDLHVELFPPSKLLQMVDSVTGDNPTMAYALAKSPLIGVRADCFGTSLFDDRMGELEDVAPDRWKTAPIVVEYCGGHAGSGDLARGRNQVDTHHVTLVEGNHDDYGDYASQEQRHLDETRKRAGYRFRLESLTLPSSAAAGSTLSISSRWANDGVAPAYADWDVLFQLVDPVTGAVAWQGESSLSLRSLLPTTGQSSLVTLAETFSLGGTLRAGATYDLAVKIQDSAGYGQPLALAISGRGSNGSYRIGSLTIR